VTQKKGYQAQSLFGTTWSSPMINDNLGSGTLSISNELNIEEVLNDFGMTDCKPVSTPAAPGTKLYMTVSSDDTADASTYPFTRTTHPQTLYAVNQYAQHCINPNSTHIQAVKRIFRYLQGTKSKALVFRRGDGTLHLKAYCDADFVGEFEGNDKPMRSISGLIVYLHGVGSLYWKAQLQRVLATSTKEAEYYSSGLCSRDMIGFRQLGAT